MATNDDQAVYNDEGRHAARADAMTVAQLKDELRRRKLKTTGNKADLVERFRAAMFLEDQRDEDVDGDDGNDMCDKTNRRDNDESESDDESENDERRRRSSSGSSRRRERCLLTFKDVEDSIDAFSGDDGKDVKQWIKDFDETANLCQWNDVQKTIYARRLLRGSAKLFVKYEAREKTWKDIKIALKREFSQKIDSHDVHLQLQRRKKRTDETYQEYCYKMMEVASRVKMETSAVIQYIIDGIHDDEVNKIILYGARSISELKRKLDMYEVMKNKSRHSKTDDRKKKFIRNDTDKRQDEKRCFNCGGKNHLSATCPVKEKGVKCFRCGEHGHIATKCPATESKQTIRKDRDCNATQSKISKCYKDVTVNATALSALIDTGSDISLMRADTYVEIGAPALVKRQIKFRGVGSDEIKTLGETRVNVYIDDDLFSITFHVVPDALLQCAILVGTDFLNNIELRVKEGVAKISKVDKQFFELPAINKIDLSDEMDEVNLEHIRDPKCRDEIREMVSNYKPEKVRDVGIELSIVLKNEIPVYQRARRLAVSEQKTLDEQIHKWLDEGIVQPSVSEYASPVVLVKKKNDTTRVCVDYRKLNEKMVKARYPLPIIEDQIDRLRGAKIFSTIDLENGFFHVAVAEDSRKYTAFIVPNGQYEFLRMPFGLSTSPAYFQKYINAVFTDLVAKNIVSIYMDDLIIPSINNQEGLQRLKEVLRTASSYGLKINWKKCQFLKTKVNYLGFIIEDGDVTPSDEKTNAVKYFPMPTDKRAIQSFLGLTGYFRKFIPKYASIAYPLTNLLKDKVIFCIGDKEKRAFDQLKEALSRRPILRIYCPSAETELHTDASSQGYGAILLQRDSEDRLFHPVYYASGKTTESEAKFHSYELEVLAIIKALRKFRVYLIGISFKIITDCQAFTQTMKKTDISTRIARWAIFLQDFQYTVEHRPGRSMRHVDALSRNALPTAMLVTECQDSILAKLQKNQEDDEEILNIREQVANNQAEGYVIKNGLLYKELKGDILIVVPKLMQSSVIQQAHEHGHFGPDKTEKLLKMNYWFKGMRRKIEEIIRNCINCVLAERKTGKREGWLHPIPKGESPFDTYHVDHLGPLPSTKKNYRHLFVVVDAFTKFVWLYPTKSTSTAEVLDRLMQQSAVFGNPRRIISDRGTAFTSHDFDAYCKDENIEHLAIVTGVPRGNGQVERINRILIPVLTKLSAPNPAQWHKHVVQAQQCLNNVPSRSTGVSPFHLLCGAHMRIKEDPIIKNLLETENATLFLEKRDDIRRQARENIAKIQEENKRSYNKKRKAPSTYRENDLVAIKRTQSGPGLKLATKYFGPYRIKRILRNDRYIVQKTGEGEGPRMTSTAVEYMKPWSNSLEDASSEEDI